MRAAAELNGLVHAHHTHDIAVFFTEQRDRAELFRVLQRHFAHRNGLCRHDGIADDAGDLRQLFWLHSLKMRQVKAQAVGLNERTRLMDMIAQHTAQRHIQKVRCRVRARDGAAAGLVIRARAALAHAQRAGGDLAVVHELSALVLLHVGHGKFARSSADHAVIGDLTAHLGVKRRAVEHHDALRALADLVAQLFVGDEREDLCLRLHAVIAHKFGRGHFLAKFHASPTEVAERLARLAGAGLLLLHELLERVLIHAHPLLVHHFGGQVDREAVGIVQLERVRAGEYRLALFLVPGEHFLEDAHTTVDGAGKALFFGLDDTGDIRLLFAQLRVLALVFVHNGVDDLIKERMIDAQQLSVPRRAAQQAAQDVAAPFVRRQHAVADHERRRADMVGDDTQGDILLVALAVVDAGQLGDLVRDVHHRVHIKE